MQDPLLAFGLKQRRLRGKNRQVDLGRDGQGQRLEIPIGLLCRLEMRSDRPIRGLEVEHGLTSLLGHGHQAAVVLQHRQFAGVVGPRSISITSDWASAADCCITRQNAERTRKARSLPLIDKGHWDDSSSSKADSDR